MWGQTGVRWMQAQAQRGPMARSSGAGRGWGARQSPPSCQHGLGVLIFLPCWAQGDAGAGQEHGLSPLELSCVQETSLEQGHRSG